MTFLSVLLVWEWLLCVTPDLKPSCLSSSVCIFSVISWRSSQRRGRSCRTRYKRFVDVDSCFHSTFFLSLALQFFSPTFLVDFSFKFKECCFNCNLKINSMYHGIKCTKSQYFIAVLIKSCCDLLTLPLVPHCLDV